MLYTTEDKAQSLPLSTLINAIRLSSLTCPESTGIKSLTCVMPDDLSNLLALNLTIDAPADFFFLNASAQACLSNTSFHLLKLKLVLLLEQ